MTQVELAAADYFLKSLFDVKLFILRTHFPIKILKQTLSSVSIKKKLPRVVFTHRPVACGYCL